MKKTLQITNLLGPANVSFSGLVRVAKGRLHNPKGRYMQTSLPPTKLNGGEVCRTRDITGAGTIYT